MTDHRAADGIHYSPAEPTTVALVEGTIETNGQPAVTPNVVIESPRIRKWVNVALSGALVLVGTAAAVDGASPAIDITAITTPAMVGLSYIAAAFNLVVTLPNVPRR